MKLSPEDNLISKYFFLLHNQTNYSLIGLNLRALNENNNNFISQLFESGLITSQKFSIYYSDITSKLFLGDFSEGTTITSFYKLMNYCKVPDKSNNWECDLSSYQFNKNSINTGSRVRFNTGVYEMVLPLIDYKIIKKLFSENLKIECIRNSNNKLSCQCEKPEIFPNLNLNINSNTFTIQLSDLAKFNRSSQYQCEFKIIVDLENEDTWILGRSVLSNTLLSFDQIKRKLGFAQNPKSFENMLSGNLIINPNDQNDSKIGFIFFFVFLLILAYGLFKCANNDKFFARKSLNADDHEDRLKLELIKNRFNAEEYDYDDMKPKEKQNKYLEMKEITKQ